MARNSYYNFGKDLKRMFPEQTKTNLHIIIWLVVFIADLVAMYFILEHFGFSWYSHGIRTFHSYLYLCALIGGGLMIFWLETLIYDKLHTLFR